MMTAILMILGIIAGVVGNFYLANYIGNYVSDHFHIADQLIQWVIKIASYLLTASPAAALGQLVGAGIGAILDGILVAVGAYKN